MADAPQITIVGAGLVGSLLSVMLARRGYRVCVYEKRPDLRKSDISAGRSINLALAERGLAPLWQAELAEEVARLLVPMRGRMLHARDEELEFQPYGQRPHEVIYSVSRGGLNKLMMTAAEQTGRVEMFFGQGCQDVDFGRRRLQLRNQANGEEREVPFDLLIGADGAGSAVRAAILQANGGSCSVDFLDHKYKELCIPAGRDGTYQMEKEALHIWPRGGYMLIALPNLDGSYTVTLFLNEETAIGKDGIDCPSFASLDSEARLVEFFEREFPDARRLLPQLVEEFAANPTGPLGTVRTDRWHVADCGLILGDASHAIVPFHGQGMNAGFEDCGELMACLEQAGGDCGVALAEFANRRPPQANAIADMALENYVIMRDSVRDPRFQLKKELGFALERQFPDRFIPRYSMVMFHRVPYATALARGDIQNGILDELTQSAVSVDQVDMQQAAALVTGRLSCLDL